MKRCPNTLIVPTTVDHRCRRTPHRQLLKRPMPRVGIVPVNFRTLCARKLTTRAQNFQLFLAHYYIFGRSLARWRLLSVLRAWSVQSAPASQLFFLVCRSHSPGCALRMLAQLAAIASRTYYIFFASPFVCYIARALRPAAFACTKLSHGRRHFGEGGDGDKSCMRFWHSKHTPFRIWT